jgi:O-antigen/teichoic acid export membrane protein
VINAAKPRHFSRGVLLTVTSTGVSVISLFVETIVTARVLSPEVYGTYILLLAVVNFFVMVADFGCEAAITQMIAGSDRERQAMLTNNVVAFRIVTVVVMSLLIWLARDWLVLFDPTRSVLVYWVYIPVLMTMMTFDELLINVLQGFQLFKHIAIAQTGRSLLRVTFSVVALLVFKLGVPGLFLSWIAAYTLAVLYELVMVPVRKRFILHRPLMTEMLRFAMPLQATRFLWFLFYRIDILLLGTLAGPLAVAYYGVANRVPEALQRVSESYIAVYYPTVSSLLARKRDRQVHWYLNHSLRLVSFLTGAGALLGVVFNQQIVRLIFSDKYMASAPAFALLMVAFHMTFMVNLMGYTLVGARRAGLSLVTNILRTTTHILADAVLIPLLGFMGPTVAANISAYINNPAQVLMLRRIGIRVAASAYVKQTALLLLGAGVYWIWQPQGVLLKLAIVLAFVVLCVALSTISMEDFSLVLPERLLRRKATQPGESTFSEGVVEGQVG